MSEYKVALFNAFSESNFGGSVAAIVADAYGMDSVQMQNIAREIGAPATGFIIAAEPDEVEVRFFSPLTEYPMCGHGTIGLMTWLIEREVFNLVNGEQLTVKLRTPAATALVDLSIRHDGRPEVMLHLDVAEFEKSDLSAETLAPLLGIDSHGILTAPAIELTRSDFTHLIVPVSNLATVKAIKPNFGQIAELCAQIKADTVAVFSMETMDQRNTIHCREFCPALGTPEAAATGTTNRALACYLLKHGLIDAGADDELTVITEQGYEIGRPSLIRAELKVHHHRVVRIRVGGVATKTMEGVFLLH
jgi:trans-2,3-dihydro-3-hydroxyanthranilate isomerase